jgi:hypothetical protein
MATQDDKPFHFLDLSPELHLIVYEQLDLIVRHHTLSELRENTSDKGSAVSAITLIVRSLEPSIFDVWEATIKEALPILRNRLQGLYRESLRIVIYCPDRRIHDGWCGIEMFLVKIHAGRIQLSVHNHPPKVVDIWREMNASRCSALVPPFASTLDRYIHQCTPTRILVALSQFPAGADSEPADFGNASFRLCVQVAGGYANLLCLQPSDLVSHEPFIDNAVNSVLPHPGDPLGDIDSRFNASLLGKASSATWTETWSET